MDQNRPRSPLSGDVTMPPDNSKPAKRPRKRPSKRFLWQEELHLRFVAAIFDLGLKNASPKALLPLMKTSDSELTTEHLKSHLQKYRINYERSRREFKELCQREAKRSRKRQRRRDRCQLNDSSAHMFQSKPQDDPEGEEHASSASTVMEGEDRRVAAATAQYPGDYMFRQQPDRVVPVSAAIPELTDAQWSMLMSAPPPDKCDFGGLSIQVPQDDTFVEQRVQEELRIQMHQAMQAQMNFHRQMLTRKVELSHDLRRSSGVENWGASNPGNLNYYVQEEHEWTRTPQQLESHRLHQQLMEQYGSPNGLPQQSLAALPQESCAVPQALPSSSQPSVVPAQPEELLGAKSNAVDEDLSQWDPFNVGLESDDLFDFLKA